MGSRVALIFYAILTDLFTVDLLVIPYVFSFTVFFIAIVLWANGLRLAFARVNCE